MFLRSLAAVRPRPPCLLPGRSGVARATMACGDDGQLITDAAMVAAIAHDAQRVAIIGVRPARDASGRDLTDRPAHFVPAALHADGVQIVAVPVPAAEAESYFGSAPVSLAGLADLPPVDVAVFFRKAADLPPPAQVIAARPRVAWLQSGIRNPEWERAVAASGAIQVVADRCIKVERTRAKL